MTGHDALNAHARDLLMASVGWMDGFWDEAAGLLRRTDPNADRPPAPARGDHMVRESVWYAAGLLLRDGPGDRERAFRAIETVLDNQWNAPEQPYHGTFRRTPDEPDP